MRQIRSLSICFESTTCWQKIILAATVLVLAPIFILSTRHPLLSSSQILPWEDRALSVISGNLEYMQSTQMVWQIPPSPRAVLFIAHGCYCRATFFWDRSANCAECIGLPEERAIVSHAITRGYAVIAISSTRECWSLQADKAKVLSVLSIWIRKEGLEGLPVVALGASSGGFFISALAAEYKFNSIVVMISEGKFKAIRIAADYPPTLFVHMVKDKRRAALIKDAMSLLKSKGVETAEVKCYQIPVTPQLFARIPGMDMKTSYRIYNALRGNSILDSNSIMVNDGRTVDWMKRLKQKRVTSEIKLRKWELHLQELLNLAYGYHEMTSSQANEIFEWFDSHIKK